MRDREEKRVRVRGKEGEGGKEEGERREGEGRRERTEGRSDVEV